MAIKSGDIIHVGNDAVLIDRLQSGGPGNLNIRRDTIYELGNYRSVGQISDIPDLSFSLESFDTSCEVEAFLLRENPKTTHVYDLSTSKVVNIKSAFKPGKSAAAPFQTVASASIPCLRLEQMQYRFGIGNQNATQTATLRGDSLYYSPGSTYIQEVAGTGSSGQTVVLTNPAYAVTEEGIERRTLAVTAGNKRLLYGVDYAETVGSETAGHASVTVNLLITVPASDTIAVVYASNVVESFPQSVHALVTGASDTLDGATAVTDTTLDLNGSTTFAAGDIVVIGTGTGAETATVASQAGATVTLTSGLTLVHADGSPIALYSPTVKPAAVRGRNIDVYIGAAGTVPDVPADDEWTNTIGQAQHGVQTVDVSWQVQLQNDEELGNAHYVETDFDVPQVSGSVTFRPVDYLALLALVEKLGGNADSLQSTSAASAPPLDLQIVIRHPDTGTVLKRLHVPDARFTVPGYQGRVQQKTDFQGTFQSDQGVLFVYDN